jgi:hypothetical protein
MCKHEWLEKPDYNVKWCPKCNKSKPITLKPSLGEAGGMPLVTRDKEGVVFNQCKAQRDADQKWHEDKLAAEREKWAREEAEWLEKLVKCEEWAIGENVVMQTQAHLAFLRAKGKMLPAIPGESYGKHEYEPWPDIPDGEGCVNK